MASRLLNVLQEIEEQRLELIEQARLYGHNVADNASFASLGDLFNTEDLSNWGIPIPEPLVTEDWVRPQEWPDCYSLLRNAEDRENLKAGVIVLLDATYSTDIVLPKYQFLPSNWSNVNVLNTCAKGYLLSDGTWYGVSDTTADITHTWDTTKDIVVEGGAFPGTYRWIIMFFDNNTYINTSMRNIYSWPAVEILVGYFRADAQCWGSYIIGGPDCALSNHLINYEILQEATQTLYLWATSGGGPRTCGLTELRHLSINKSNVVFQTSNSSNLMIPWGCPKLRRFDISACREATSGGTYISIDGAWSLVEFKLPSTFRTLYFGKYVPRGLRTLDALGLTTCYALGTYKTPGIDTNWNITEPSIYYTFINTRHFTMANKDITNMTFSVGGALCILQELDLEECYYSPQTSSSSSILTNNTTTNTISGNYLPSLTNIIFPEHIIVRYNLSQLSLLKSCIIDILNKLEDLNEVSYTYYNPFITLGSINLSKLTAEEIAIATNKGWVIN